MRKGVFIEMAELPEMIADYFGVPPKDVIQTEKGFMVLTEKEKQDEADRT
jgi:hypothetical protein